MKKLKIILLLIIACPILFWGASYARCELLTYQHGQEFETLYKANNMIGEQEYLKVLDYSDASARIYYVSINGYGGNILKFVKNDGKWVYDSWERVVWSKYGSADGFVWPYIR